MDRREFLIHTAAGRGHRGIRDSRWKRLPPEACAWSTRCSRAQLQSISDQDDHLRYSSIATGSSAALLPEQMGAATRARLAASRELQHGERHARPHSSKRIAASPATRQPGPGPTGNRGLQAGNPALCSPIHSVLGTPDLTRPDLPAALGMRAPEKQFLAVWRRSGPDEVHVPCRGSSFRLLYPSTWASAFLPVPMASGCTFLRREWAASSRYERSEPALA
jgi:hypothetical protein